MDGQQQQQQVEPLLREMVASLHDVRRDMAVLTERLANEKDARDIFAISYERRHTELQQVQAEAMLRIVAGERDRELLRVGLTELKQQLASVERNVDGISSSIRWVVYLVLGLIITALVGVVIGGALGHLQVK